MLFFKQKSLNKTAVQNLKIAEAIAAEIRLRTYLKYDCQYERMSIIAPDFQTTSSLENSFCLKNIDDPQQSLLFRFYYTILPLHDKLSDFLNGPNG